MIRLATVFSGIGAIEHALTRMNIDHKIVFACDNGDVDVLSKKIDSDIDQIDAELISLNSLINGMNFSDDDDYGKQLLNMLNVAEDEFQSIKNNLNILTIDNDKEIVKNILTTILKMDNLNKNRIKIYNGFLSSIDSECSDLQMKLLLYQIILKLSNDFKKDNPIENLGKDIEFKSTLNIDWSSVNDDLKICHNHLEEQDGKKIIRQVKNLSQRVGQLHGKINSLHHLDEIADIEDYSEKKKYVDELYEGNEKRNKVKISYMENYDCSEENFHWDVTFLDGTQYRNQVDLFVGGSPCQSFSMVGKQRGLSDTRGTLFYEYARLVDEVQPKVFIYENVRAVLSNDCGRTWEKMKEVFKQLGYNVFYTKDDGNPSILNAKDYGIPQNRNRLFVVGFRSDIKLNKDFEFPKAIPLDKTMQDFLMDNAPGGYFLPKKGVAFVTKEKNLEKSFTQIDGDIALCQKKNQEFNWHGDFVFQSEDDAKKNNIPNLEKYFLSEKVKKTVLSPGSKNFYSKPETDLEVARPLLSSMHKMHRAGVDNYVTTEGRLRRLTPRECLRLMGFSDDWKIVVSDTAMYQQAGNSIVVDVLIHIMNEIIKVYPELTNT